MRRVVRIAWAAAMLVAAPPVEAHLAAQAVPAKYNLTARPGEPIARDVLVDNLGDSPVIVRVRYSDWTLSEHGDLDLVAAGSTPASLADCVRFEPHEFSLGPGESGRVHVTMTLPAIGPSTRWGVLLSEVRPAILPQGAFGPRAIAELGTTLYLSRIPANRVEARLTSMDVSRVGSDSMRVSLGIRNDGERHLYVGGEIAIRDLAGRAVQSGTVGIGVILPQSMRVFTWTCEAALAPGAYTVVATLDTGEPELRVGETRIQWPLPATVEPPLAQQSQSP